MVGSFFKSFVPNPPATRFEGEDPGEKVLYVLRKSLVTNFGWVLLSILFIVVPSFVDEFIFSSADLSRFITPQLAFNLTALWYVFTFGFIFTRYINWYFNVYVITNMRIIDMDFYSLLARSVSVAPLRNIEDITYDVHGTFESLFNVGDVTIQTAAERPRFDFEKVDNPAKIHDILSDLVKEVKGV